VTLLRLSETAFFVVCVGAALVLLVLIVAAVADLPIGLVARLWGVVRVVPALIWLKWRAFKSWLWMKVVWPIRRRKDDRLIAERESKGLPVYIRCADHKDFGGSCENDATWAIIADFNPDNMPTYCDGCAEKCVEKADGTMKRVGPGERR
jgi:hypothetical protein